MSSWNPIWYQAMTTLPFGGKAFGKEKTVAFRICSGTAGNGIRFRFSNKLGYEPYEIGSMTFCIGDRRHDVTHNGNSAFAIPKGGKTCSDATQENIRVGDEIEVRIYYKNYIIDGNMIEEEATLLSGDRTKNSEYKMKKSLPLKLLGAYNAVPALDMIEVNGDAPVKAIVAFGDSITSMSRWTKPLGKRLREKFDGKVVLLNAGILGNCLLYERSDFLGPLYGKKGVERFDEDVLGIDNLSSLILGFGVNDVSYYTKKTKDIINLDSFKNGLANIVKKAHDKGVKVTMQTITPRLKCSITMGVYKKEMEEQRLIFNDWIRNSDIFDYVFDADELVRQETRDGWVYNEKYHQGDHLHPNSEGGALLANSFDLTKLI